MLDGFYTPKTYHLAFFCNVTIVTFAQNSYSVFCRFKLWISYVWVDNFYIQNIIKVQRSCAEMGFLLEIFVKFIYKNKKNAKQHFKFTFFFSYIFKYSEQRSNIFFYFNLIKSVFLFLFLYFFLLLSGISAKKLLSFYFVIKTGTPIHFSCRIYKKPYYYLRMLFLSNRLRFKNV